MRFPGTLPFVRSICTRRLYSGVSKPFQKWLFDKDFEVRNKAKLISVVIGVHYRILQLSTVAATDSLRAETCDVPSVLLASG